MKTLRYIWSKNLSRIQLVWNTLMGILKYYFLPKHPIQIETQEGQKVILFLGDSLQARIPRMVKWLKRTGEFECILVVSHGKDFDAFNSEFFSHIFSYRSHWELKWLLERFQNIYAIHGICTPTKHIRIAIEHTDFPVITDVQDLYVAYYGLNPPYLYMQLELPNEKFCMLQSDAILAQSLEPIYGNRMYEIPKAERPKNVFFPLYCDEDYMTEPAKKLDLDDIHVVYVGSIAGSFQVKDQAGLVFFRLIEQMNQQRIHFHIYPGPHMRFKDQVFAEYEAADRKYPYFHFHDTLAQDQLAQEISQYHFGILPIFNKEGIRSPEKRQYNTSLKLFNYIEAGLPIIISEDLKYQNWMARRYAAAISICYEDIERLRDLIEPYDYEQNLAYLYRERKKISLGHNIPRLIRLYDQIAENRLT